MSGIRGRSGGKRFLTKQEYLDGKSLEEAIETYNINKERNLDDLKRELYGTPGRSGGYRHGVRGGAKDESNGDRAISKAYRGDKALYNHNLSTRENNVLHDAREAIRERREKREAKESMNAMNKDTNQAAFDAAQKVAEEQYWTHVDNSDRIESIDAPIMYSPRNEAMAAKATSAPLTNEQVKEREVNARQAAKENREALRDDRFNEHYLKAESEAFMAFNDKIDAMEPEEKAFMLARLELNPDAFQSLVKYDKYTGLPKEGTERPMMKGFHAEQVDRFMNPEKWARIDKDRRYNSAPPGAFHNTGNGFQADESLQYDSAQHGAYEADTDDYSRGAGYEDSAASAIAHSEAAQTYFEGRAADRANAGVEASPVKAAMNQIRAVQNMGFNAELTPSEVAMISEQMRVAAAAEAALKAPPTRNVKKTYKNTVFRGKDGKLYSGQSNELSNEETLIDIAPIESGGSVGAMRTARIQYTTDGNAKVDYSSINSKPIAEWSSGEKAVLEALQDEVKVYNVNHNYKSNSKAVVDIENSTIPMTQFVAKTFEPKTDYTPGVNPRSFKPKNK